MLLRGSSEKILANIYNKKDRDFSKLANITATILSLMTTAKIQPFLLSPKQE